MQDLRRPCPKEHLEHAGKNRLPKTTLRPMLLSTPSLLPTQKPVPRLSKPRGEDASMDGEDAIILHTLSRSRLRDDAPKKEKHTKTPPSPDPTDLRFPFETQAVGRRSNSTMTLPRKITAPAGAAVAGSGENWSKDFSRTCVDHLPPPTAAH